MPEAKTTPRIDTKKPEEQQKNDAPKVPIAPDQKKEDTPNTAEVKPTTATEPKKSEEKSPKLAPKAETADGQKKPAEKPKSPEPKAAPATEPKKSEDKTKAPEPKVSPAPAQKKPEEKPKVTESKAVAATAPKKTEEKPKAPAPKAAPTTEGTKPEEKTPTADTGKKYIPKDKANEPKNVPTTGPKAKDTAVEPKKGVRITQIFADRLEKPTQEDLKSLPVPKDGEGFSMRLHPAYFFEFLDHPFSVNRETDDYKELFDSIKENGINEPIKARPREGGGLELISGHRRHDVAIQLNYPVPVVIVQADNDSAQIECVDGNLHRKDIPTSELARAAKMKIDAMSRKAGRRSKMDQLTSPQKRTDQIVAEEMGYSRTQLTRLVRIDSLVPELKQMVDSKKVPFNVGVELSYMSEQEQKDLVGVMKKDQIVPSLSQAQQMKEASQKAAKAAKEAAAKAPKPVLQVVTPQTKSEQASLAVPGADNNKTTATSPTPTVSVPPAAIAPAPPPAPKPPAPIGAKQFASIMKDKPEPELKVIFTGSELKDYFPGRTPTIPEVKRAVFDALDLRKKALDKQNKKQDIVNTRH